jgi:hypothetical protein
MSQLKNKKFAIPVAIIVIVTASVIGVYFVPTQTTETMIPPTQEDQERNDALGVAQKYIVTSPTFTFDGDINTLDTEYVGSLESFPPQYMIKISFDSAHGGFGNREGQMLTQIITPHKMDIVVSEGIVISAVTDETWDEMNNQYVLKPQPKLPSSDEPVIPFDGMATDYPSLVDAIKSRGVLVEYVEEIASESSSFSVPTKVISVGGADVQVFEFASESDAKAASLTISQDGTEIGTSIIRWIDTPHFYTNGKLIVLYVGQNPEIVNLLESFLGKQFAGM